MKKKKRFVERFINHLFGVYNAKRVPIYVHYGYKSCIATDGRECFGCYSYPKNDGEGETCIHVAGDLGTTTLLQVIAHEFVHYIQHINGRDMNDEAVEDDAEYWGAGLMGQWLINKKRIGEHCYGVAEIWTEKPKEG